MSKVVRDKVKAYLTANWSATAIAGEENAVDNPPTTLAPWLAYGLNTYGELATSIGGGCFRDEGIIEFYVYSPSGRSIDTGLTHAESVRTMFRNLDLGDGVRCTTASAPDSQVATSDGNWYLLQVEVDYMYDYQI